MTHGPFPGLCASPLHLSRTARVVLGVREPDTGDHSPRPTLVGRYVTWGLSSRARGRGEPGTFHADARVLGHARGPPCRVLCEAHARGMGLGEVDTPAPAHGAARRTRGRVAIRAWDVERGHLV